MFDISVINYVIKIDYYSSNKKIMLTMSNIRISVYYSKINISKTI